MQAMNGSAGFRARGRLIGCCMALVLALSALVFSSVASATPPPTTYLAVGDSLAFGYTQEKHEEFAKYNEPPGLFEEGYPNFLQKKLKMASAKFATPLRGLKLINNGCPGETSDSLIGNGPVGEAVDPTGTAPCPYRSEEVFPQNLHHEYGGTKSQLESALEVIAVNSATMKNVTVNIGANDELQAIKKCKTEVKEEGEKYLKAESSEFSKYNSEEKKHPKTQAEVGESIAEAIHACISNSAPATINHILNNLGATLTVLREGSKFGGVDYTGTIEVLGAYNPQTFLVGGSDVLQSALNGGTKQVAEKFGAKYNDGFSKINPQKGGEGSPKEAEAICKYTEMCNKKVQEANAKKAEETALKEKGEGKIIEYPPNCTTGGPECLGDIHPTVAGYQLLANRLFNVYTP
jgi:lysophospholipase L1-like esterase